jgi:predicted ATPase
MLRELADALEVISHERPLVLRLEDLHWSDHSTLEWLGFLARRRETARLLVLGSYRPVEVIVRDHPLKHLKQELQIHRQCHELPLPPLSEAAVMEYLTLRFTFCQSSGEKEQRGRSIQEPIRKLAQSIYQRTDGNPLFMVNVINYAVSQGIITKRASGWKLDMPVETLADGVPTNLRELIEQGLERLTSAEERDLEAASVAGQMFSAAAIAAAVNSPLEAVEERLSHLARHSAFLQERSATEWPDATVAAGFSFLHSIYREVLYERVPAARRALIHLLIAQRMEKAYGVRAKEIAAELAEHYQHGRSFEQAVKYLCQAAKNAGRRNAFHEAITLLNKGQKLLATLPDTPQRARQELDLGMTLGHALMATRGQAAPEMAQAYNRARELSMQLGETSPLFHSLSGLAGFHMVRADLRAARELGEQLVTIAQAKQDVTQLVSAHMSLGLPLFWQGEFTRAHEQLERAITMYKAHKDAPAVFRAKQDRWVLFSYSAWTLWYLGYPAHAVMRRNQSIALAYELADPISLAVVSDYAAFLSYFRRESQLTQEHSATAIALSTEHGLPYWWAIGTILNGWARADQGSADEGITQIRRGILAYHDTGAELLVPYSFGALADAYGMAGHAQDGLAALAEGLAVAARTGEHSQKAELYRLKGMLTLKNKAHSPCRAVSSMAPNLTADASCEAEASFLKAIDIAHRQNAKSLELRAAINLGHLWQYSRRREAHELLSEIYNWFTEGFDTTDLKEAKLLLDDLSR